MVGKLIKIFRQKKGIGVMELAKKLKINRISLFRIEKGQRCPSEKIAIKAFKTFGLSEENIYQVFVFNELFKYGKLSKNSEIKKLSYFFRDWIKKMKMVWLSTDTLKKL